MLAERIYSEIHSCLEEWKKFLREYRRLGLYFALVVLIVYGGRIVSDDFFIDSEAMITQPDVMRYIWMGSNRFGMVFTSRLFGFARLCPWMSNVLMGIGMWCCAMFLAFYSYSWTNHSRRYRHFIWLFPTLFLTAPVFTEQYLFLLQSFEISVGILLTFATAWAGDCFALKKLGLKTIVGLMVMVWAFGTYQILVPVYITLAVIAFLLRYLNGEANKALSYGLRQIVYFLAGIAAIKMSVRNVFAGTNVFFRKYYFPAMLLCSLQLLWYGWKKKTGMGNYLCLLFGEALLLLSPFYMILLTGGL